MGLRFAGRPALKDEPEPSYPNKDNQRYGAERDPGRQSRVALIDSRKFYSKYSKFSFHFKPSGSRLGLLRAMLTRKHRARAMMDISGRDITRVAVDSPGRIKVTMRGKPICRDRR